MNPGVLITRPLEQSEKLCQQLESLTIQPYLLPTIEIVPYALNSLRETWQQQLTLADIVIFISANAVECSPIAELPPTNTTRIAAIGSATAEALAQHGIRVDIVPENKFNSEGLLALLPAEMVANKHILIVKGQDGRETLQQTLEQRGASVQTLDVYQRQCPKPTNLSTVLAAWQQQQIQLVLVTSVLALENLVALLGQAGYAYFTQTPLLVSSQRIAERAKALGIQTNPIVAENASDIALVACIRSWLKNTMRTT